MKGLIFSIKKYAIHDGPGIRVTFFLKGCPLSCWWCHNPEGISPGQETAVQSRRVGEKEFLTSEVAGRYYSVEELMEVADKEKIFFQQSGGGVTFSGGEPLLQFEFLLEALKACKANGYHTVVDTSGYSSSSNFKAIMAYTDLFLFDIKHLDEPKHIEITGVSNTGILNNLTMILKNGKKVTVRIPVIPGLNDDIGHLEKLKRFLESLKSYDLENISLLPYHRIGISKYRRFNIPYRMIDIEQPSLERMKVIKDFISESGLKVKIGG